MTWPDLFQTLCLAVLAAAYALYLRAVPAADRRRAVLELALVALGAWASEETSILRYGVYAYPDWWWLRLDRVPLVVVLIWPMVVMSARAVVDGLFPARRGASRALLVGLVVVVDASLVEVLAVRAELWAWTLPGYLDVPVIGILGWGAYAAAVTWALERWPRRPWVAPALALGLTHLALVALWWGLFKWASVPLPGFVVHLVTLAAIVVAMVLLKHRSRRIAWQVALPRMLAASVFVVLLAQVQLGAEGPLAFHWLHLMAVALVYVTAVRWPSRPALDRGHRGQIS
ncbi:MAG: hypothetical protein IT385_22995 [Deltaproteobacteria bacterium]|nr:hypothetical protein [Deltaproteobacteria bacterium]